MKRAYFSLTHCFYVAEYYLTWPCTMVAIASNGSNCVDVVCKADCSFSLLFLSTVKLRLGVREGPYPHNQLIPINPKLLSSLPCYWPLVRMTLNAKAAINRFRCATNGVQDYWVNSLVGRPASRLFGIFEWKPKAFREGPSTTHVPRHFVQGNSPRDALYIHLPVKRCCILERHVEHEFL